MQLPLPIAHALVGKSDLPIPEWLFAWGASLVLIVSFVALTLAWQRARFEEEGWRPVSDRLSRALVNRVTAFMAGALSVFLLGVTVWSGCAAPRPPTGTSRSRSCSSPSGSGWSS